MKLYSLTLKNFRGYRKESVILFDNLTTIVGKNDIGKSSILEAVDIFLNGSAAIHKLEKADINVDALRDGETDIEITAEFIDIPDSIIIDSTNRTSLADEYLLTREGRLKLRKVYPNAGRERVYIIANHPTQKDCADLITLKQRDLKSKVEQLGLDCDKSKNAEMRKAIRDYFAKQEDLLLQEVSIECSKENVKDIWSKLIDYLPVYSLFVSDRTNNEGDKIVQDPLKFAVQRMFNDNTIKSLCHQISERVINELQCVATGTLAKLNEMNPEVANQLKPSIGKEDELKWSDIFKNVSIAGDNGIQINKHGSGVRRLILLNFFRYEAEKMVTEGKDVVYAIEEPETSQHNEHIHMMMDALKALSHRNHIQIILTSHSPYLVKQLEYSQLRLVEEKSGMKTINNVNTARMPYNSLNEVNYLAFGEVSEEYHDELYGHLESKNLLDKFKSSQPKQNYIRLKNKGNTSTITEQKCKTEIIRHQIHHPENTLNTRYTDIELKESIELMRNFIMTNP